MASRTAALEVLEFEVPQGSRPHEVAPAPDGSVWYTAQCAGALGLFDPISGENTRTAWKCSSPHGVIPGPDGSPWVTDSGLNAIVRVDSATNKVNAFRLPASASAANLNTAVFDRKGTFWFTGQSGFYRRLNTQTGSIDVWTAPRGRGPYGITVAPNGSLFYASLAGSHIAEIDPATGAATGIEPPTAGQGARRVWSESIGRIWVSEWNVGQVGMFDPATCKWREWRLPGERPMPYAIYVDERDIVWISDFGSNSIVSFDPVTEKFVSYPLTTLNASVRQILGRPGEVGGLSPARTNSLRYAQCPRPGP